MKSIYLLLLIDPRCLFSLTVNPVTNQTCGRNKDFALCFNRTFSTFLKIKGILANTSKGMYFYVSFSFLCLSELFYRVRAILSVRFLALKFFCIGEKKCASIFLACLV